MEVRDKAYKDRLKGMKYKEIAEKYGVSESTVKSWNSRYWSKKKVATKTTKKLQPSTEKSQPKKPKPRGAPKGNQNAAGNSGGGAPLGNQNAVTNGFFKKIFPDDSDTIEIVSSIYEKEPVDIIWENIVIQYTAIARAQKIMYVKDSLDKTKVLKKIRPGEWGKEIEFEYQFAWDKQANFLQAQSRAMQTLGNLIKQFNDIADPYDERRLKIQSMQLDIDKKNKDLGEAGKDNDLVKKWAERVREARGDSNG